MSDVVIFTGADAKFFRMCLGLVLSLRRAAPVPPRIRVLDLGLAPRQVQTLTPLVEAILTPHSYVGAGRDLPLWFRAFTARPYLPRYVDDADTLVWLDADSWVQEWSAVANLIGNARSGRIAIVEERYGPSVTISYRRPDGTQAVFEVTAESRRHNVTDCYLRCFGEEAAAKYGGMANFNSGVWALRRDSPSWAIYGEMTEAGLSRAVHNLVEQQALNIAIRAGKIPVAPQPQVCNFTLNQELPGFDTETSRFVLPRPPHEPIAVLHFTDLKTFSHLTLPRVPQGGEVQVPIHFLDWLDHVRS
jgi:hypothetical protein